MSRYYALDELGWPWASFACPQPDQALEKLPIRPSEHHYWSGTQWVEDEGKALEQARESASLSRADFKLGLLDMGELDAVKAVMADPDTDPRVVILWEDSARFNRMHPDLLSFAQVMGYTESQLDHLFGIESGGVNINTADFDTLRDLNGVDEVRAQAIIDGRPWTDVNDLTTIQGISQEMVDSWDVTV